MKWMPGALNRPKHILPIRVEDSSLDTSTSPRYTSVAIWLHWVIATFIIVQISLGVLGSEVETALGDTAIAVHKVLGITILVLTLVRIVWRLTHKAPALPSSVGPVWQFASRLVHGLLYALLLIIPLSGWWMASAFPKRHPIEAGLFDIPFLPVSVNMASAGTAYDFHAYGGWLMSILLAMHISAALKHHFIDRDGILSRMSLR
jgi:cytochrome b561